jgi:tRNA threonylcarbamoyladenosine biosynthesis protein TsaE
MPLDLVTHSPEETQQIGRRLGEGARPGDVVLLIGDLGTGKTCLTQGIARGLGINDYVLSPSFVIVRELHGRLPLFHVDLYRLDRLEETEDLGLDDYFYDGGISVVEWAEKAMGLMPPEHLRIDLTYVSDTDRRLRLQPKGKRYDELVAGLENAISAAGE